MCEPKRLCLPIPSTTCRTHAERVNVRTLQRPDAVCKQNNSVAGFRLESSACAPPEFAQSESRCTARKQQRTSCACRHLPLLRTAAECAPHGHPAAQMTPRPMPAPTRPATSPLDASHPPFCTIFSLAGTANQNRCILTQKCRGRQPINKLTLCWQSPGSTLMSPHNNAQTRTICTLIRRFAGAGRATAPHREAAICHATTLNVSVIPLTVSRWGPDAHPHWFRWWSSWQPRQYSLCRRSQLMATQEPTICSSKD
jgi:hypothetical protein